MKPTHILSSVLSLGERVYMDYVSVVTDGFGSGQCDSQEPEDIELLN